MKKITSLILAIAMIFAVCLTNASAEEYSPKMSDTEYDEKLNEIIDKMDSSWNDFEKVLYIHDYVVSNFEYDTDDFEDANYTAQGMFETGKGVCQAYTYLVRDLLNKAGVENQVAASFSMGHTWNLVKVDGMWYHVDATFDDPTPDRIGNVPHTYFLLSDAAIKGAYNSLGDTYVYPHSDWFEINSIFAGTNEATNTCTSTKYDRSGLFFRNSIAAVQYSSVNNMWYCVLAGGDSGIDTYIYSAAKANGTYALATINSSCWRMWDAQMFCWIGTFSGFAEWNGSLYFNDETHIYKLDTKTNTSKAIYTYTEGKGYIYGLKVVGNQIVYQIDTDSYTGAYETATFELISKFRGDIDNDYTVTVEDVVNVMQYLCNSNATAQANMVDAQNADIDNDGKVTMKDALLISRMVANWDII